MVFYQTSLGPPPLPVWFFPGKTIFCHVFWSLLNILKTRKKGLVVCLPSESLLMYVCTIKGCPLGGRLHGLDLYMSWTTDICIHWLDLLEDFFTGPTPLRTLKVQKNQVFTYFIPAICFQEISV